MKLKQVYFNDEILVVLEDTNLDAFRTVPDEEKESFYKWADDHAPTTVSSIYHPLTQNVMLRRMIREMHEEGFTFEGIQVNTQLSISMLNEILHIKS